jgi:hypothetical protein
MSGLLLRNNVGVGKIGTVAFDARFTNYGDYAQRMMEAIRSSWSSWSWSWSWSWSAPFMLWIGRFIFPGPLT